MARGHHVYDFVRFVAAKLITVARHGCATSAFKGMR